MKLKIKPLDLILCLLAVALILFEFLPATLFRDETVASLTKTAATRFIGGLIFLLLIRKLDYRIYGGGDNFIKNLLLCVPALIIVVNNLPIIGLISGEAYVEKVGLIPLFAFECLAIGFFEELAFRGFVFPYILESRRKTKTGIFWSIVLSCAVFGLIHLINLFTGSSPLAVLLQIGYSFLIGGMCSVVLLRTGSVFPCIILHAIYDFCGYLVPTLGGGLIWDTATVTITVILSVFTLIYMVILFAKTDVSAAEKIFYVPK